MQVQTFAQAPIWRRLFSTGFLACCLTLAACNDKGNESPNVLTPTPEPTPDAVLLTGLVDRIFQQDANAEPESLNTIEIEDNADEFSFTYLLQ